MDIPIGKKMNCNFKMRLYGIQKKINDYDVVNIVGTNDIYHMRGY